MNKPAKNLELKMQQEGQTKVILVLGAPGSGKGTQCKILAEKTEMVHISTGDLCREAVRLNTELGQRVGEHLQRGDLVPDDLMIEIIEERLRQPDAVGRGVLLDGYPRTEKQAYALANSGLNIEKVLFLQCPDNVCVERIMGRRVDPITGHAYNIRIQECAPPADDVITPRLVQRENDQHEDIVRVRLQYFNMNLAKVLRFFQGKTFPVNAAKLGQSLRQLTKL